MPIECPQRYVEYGEMRGAPAAGCKLIDEALGWPHAIGDAICTRCQVETREPTVHTIAVAKTICKVMIAPLLSFRSDAEIAAKYGMSRAEAAASARAIGCTHVPFGGPGKVSEARRQKWRMGREIKEARQAKPCRSIDMAHPTGQICGIGPIYPCAIHGECSYCSRPVGKVHSCVVCSDYVDAAQVTVPVTAMAVREAVIAVGMTTANRPGDSPRYTNLAAERGWRTDSPIEWSLDSLRESGFDDVTVFAEPGVSRPKTDSGVRWIERSEPHGSWLNWRGALRQLYDEYQSAKGILLVQDDVIFCRGMREYLESFVWPANAGVVSLYCSAKYTEPGAVVGNLKSLSAGSHFWGACALLFSRECALELLASPVVETLHGNKIDNRVGKWCQATGKSLLVFTPSLTQHIGEFRSTLNHGGGGGLAAADFVGADFDIRGNDASYGRIAVALPLFGCGDLAKRCIDCLSAGTPHDLVKVWLVDDCGPRDDLELAVAALTNSGLEFEVITNGGNCGFTRSVNRVIEASGDAHVLILNSDAYVAPGAIERLCWHLESNLTIGSIGPLEYRLDTVGPYQDIRKRPHLASLASYLPDNPEIVAGELAKTRSFAERHPTTYFCTLLRREAIDDAGKLDERLASGLSADNLHCDRLRANGWLVGVAEDALALHQGSASFKRAGLPKWEMQATAKSLYRQIVAGAV